VHNPSTGETFSAEAGRGAFAGGERLRVAEGERLLSSRTEMRAGEFDGFDGWQLEPLGSIALKLAMVAAGRGAATLSRGPKWEWDVCAGSLLVTEAGGVATDAFGEELRFNNGFPKVRGVLAGSPNAVARLRAKLGTLGMSSRMDELSPK
jgi:myo-inositol-1(or 4)-monophosphatase